MRRIIPASAILLVSLLVLAVVPAYAVENGGIGGKPAYPRADNPRTQSIFIYSLKGGQQTTDGVRLINSTPTTKTIHVYPTDGTLASGGAYSCAQEVEARKAVGSWITMSQTDVTVPSGGEVVVPFTVAVPANAEVGEHDGCIAIQDGAATTQSAKSGVLLTFRSAIRVAVTVPGKIVKQLVFGSVNTAVNDDGNLVVTPTIKNTGNVSLDTKLTTTLSPLVGAKTSVQNGSFPILPHSSANWNFEIKRPFWGGLYHAVVNASYNPDPTSGIGANDSHPRTISKESAILYVAPQALGFFIELIVLAAIAAVVAYAIWHSRRHEVVKVRWSTYKVKQNDTIVKVAQQHHVSWKRLAAANKLKAPYHLEPGQELKVPPKTDSQE